MTEILFILKALYLLKILLSPDFNKPNNDIKIMETRLLIKTIDDWVALPYIWNEEQTDAVLEITGQF